MFFDTFKDLCNQRNETPNSVCLKLGFSAAAAPYWKKSGRPPKREGLEKIAEYFGVSIDYLLQGEKMQIQTVNHNVLNKEIQSVKSESVSFGIDFGTTSSGIIGTVQKESLPIKTTRSEMFNILSQLTDDELDDLLNYARFLLAKR